MSIKNHKGFSLMELVITFVVFAILIVLVVGSYGIFVKEAKTSEGIMLASSIAKIQKMYYAEFSEYKPAENASFTEVPEIDAKLNKYFKTFSVYVPGKVDGAAFTVQTSSEGTILYGVEVVLHVFKSKGNIMTVYYTEPTGEKSEFDVR